MRLLIYSDLHLENHSSTPPPAAVKQADAVILAGDIKEGGGLASARKMFPKTEIVYVAGNHEFYKGSSQKKEKIYRDFPRSQGTVGMVFLEDSFLVPDAN